MNGMPAVFDVAMFTQLAASFLAIFAVRECFALRGILPGKYLFTPLVTLSVILIALLAGRSGGLGYFTTMVLVGLLLSMVADTLLMIEESDHFIHGLVFFLLTHIAYIAAFAQGYAFKNWHWVLMLVLGMGGGAIYAKIKSASWKLNLAVGLYVAILASMSFYAWAWIDRPGTTRAVLLPVAATLFMISDSILAVNTFVKKIPHSTVFTWTFYAPAQFLIAVSCFY
ncbi:MAG: lysoplasmalogenase [Spirochaetes bacterium]|nr:MAG: lysoplasmalogenase [Spirochaetota bacterium]